MISVKHNGFHVTLISLIIPMKNMDMLLAAVVASFLLPT